MNLEDQQLNTAQANDLREALNRPAIDVGAKQLPSRTRPEGQVDGMSKLNEWLKGLCIVWCICVTVCVGISLNTTNTKFQRGETVTLKATGETGMVITHTFTGYRVRVGTNEIFYQEFELEKR